jgi:hypothetical protein
LVWFDLPLFGVIWFALPYLALFCYDLLEFVLFWSGRIVLVLYLDKVPFIIVLFYKTFCANYTGKRSVFLFKDLKIPELDQKTPRFIDPEVSLAKLQ